MAVSTAKKRKQLKFPSSFHDGFQEEREFPSFHAYSVELETRPQASTISRPIKRTDGVGGESL